MTLQVRKGISERVEALLQNAVLAPSSHNTQPWRFQVSGDRIALYADRTRALPVNDPEDRELTISCGCALMNLRVAAAQAGLGVKVGIQPDSGEEDLLAVAEIHDTAKPEISIAGLFPAISARRTFRKRFRPEKVPDSVIGKLSESADREHAWLESLDEPRTREQAASLVSEGDAVQWANPSWRRELAAWMHPRRRGDGLTVPWLVGPVAQVVVRTFDMGNGVGAKDAELATESPLLVVLGTDRDGVKDWLQAGQALERVLLTACSEGLQTSYLNQPVQVAALRSRLQHVIDRSGFPQILMRLGYPGEELPAAPRRDLEELMD